MEKYSYQQLQKICTKNKPKGVRCAGRGVTKAYLYDKLSSLGLLESPRAASPASNTAKYLLSLSQDVREKIIKTFPVASASKKQAMTEVAEAFANTPAWKITEYCTKIKDLCEDSFYEALFHDVYPDIHKMLSKVTISTEMKSFHDEYRPESIDKKEESEESEESEGSEDEESEKRHYHFWEHLYVEIDALTANKKNRRLLEDVLNEGRVVSENTAIFKAYPFLSVYLANALPFFVEDVIVKNDMELYRYLDVPLTEMEIMLDSGKPNIISIVLSDGRVDPSTYNNQAIRSASQFGHLEVVKLLLADSRVDPTADNNEAIRSASQFGHLEVVKLLLADSRVDPTADNNFAIRTAAFEGHAEVVKLLLADPRVDPTLVYNYAIRYASRRGHLEVVKLLLTDSRVDPSADNNQAIRLAAFKGHADVVKLLLADSRVDPHVDENEAIREASYEGHAEVVKLLLADERADPSAENNSAIRLASWFGHVEVVKLLLADGRVDPGTDNNYAIRHASSKGHAEVVKLLLADSRVDPSANSAYYSADNNQAIGNASRRGHAEVVRLLLADGRADPAANYNEAIRNASKYGYVEIVELLLADGRADPTVKDHDAILATLIRERSEMKAQISTKRAEMHKPSTSAKEQRKLEKEVAETLIARNKLNSRISLHRNKIKESFKK